MVKFWTLLMVVFCFAGAARAQQSAETYEKEQTFGINFNTNGGILGGVSFRSAHTISDNWLRFWGVEVVAIKHPKENKWLGQSGDVFVLGKTNYLFVIRPEYGREYILFRKAAESGVEVNGIFAVGPSIGLLVPYYIDYDVNKVGRQGGTQTQNIQRVRYDPLGAHAEYDYIIRGAPFLTGINETDFNFGAHMKAALSFEYGRYQESITGVETGFLLEAYPHKLVMLPQAENYKVFTSVYLTLYYGRRK